MAKSVEGSDKNFPNYYHILGLQKNATADEIDNKWWYASDVNKADKTFREAYLTLSNKAKRISYDELLTSKEKIDQTAKDAEQDFNKLQHNLRALEMQLGEVASQIANIAEIPAQKDFTFAQKSFLHAVNTYQPKTDESYFEKARKVEDLRRRLADLKSQQKTLRKQCVELQQLLVGDFLSATSTARETTQEAPEFEDAARRVSIQERPMTANEHRKRISQIFEPAPGGQPDKTQDRSKIAQNSKPKTPQYGGAVRKEHPSRAPKETRQTTEPESRMTIPRSGGADGAKNTLQWARERYLKLHPEAASNASKLDQGPKNKGRV